jgi:hypothetical protein
MDAENALAAKQAELADARETVKAIEAECDAARAAARQAQTEADALLPQCRVVTIHRRTGNRENRGDRHVIVRRTPSGILLVRPVGDAGAHEMRFKFDQHSHRYRLAEKGSFVGCTLELCDVPDRYMPENATTLT